MKLFIAFDKAPTEDELAMVEEVKYQLENQTSDPLITFSVELVGSRPNDR